MTGSATKQSISRHLAQMDCFVEPVIGRTLCDPVARNDGPNRILSCTSLNLLPFPCTPNPSSALIPRFTDKEEQQ